MMDLVIAVLGSGALSAGVTVLTTRRSQKASTDNLIVARINSLVEDIGRLETKLDGAIQHIDSLRVYIYDNVPNADPPMTPAFLRK